MKASFCVVMTTISQGAAKKITRSILTSRLAACINIIPALASHYWWKGKIETCRESLLLIKTESRQVSSLIKYIQEIHPYAVPEILSLPINKGNSSYLNWLSRELLPRSK